jgi:hypothetical protein
LKQAIADSDPGPGYAGFPTYKISYIFIEYEYLFQKGTKTTFLSFILVEAYA